MQNMLVKLFGCGLLVFLFQNEGQCSNTVLMVTIGQTFTVETDLTDLRTLVLWYGILNGQSELLAICTKNNCKSFQTAISSGVQSATFQLYKYFLKVINVSPILTRIETSGNSWDIVFIENEISTLLPMPHRTESGNTAYLATTPTPVYETTSFWTTPPRPCFLCGTESPTTNTTQYTNSSIDLVIWLSLGAGCLVVIAVCIPALCCHARGKCKAAAGTPEEVSHVFVVQAIDDPPPVSSQMLNFDVSLNMNQRPTAPPSYREQPPSYKSLPPSYESVMRFHRPSKNIAM